MRKLIIIISLIILLILSGCKLSEIKEKVPGQTVSGKTDFEGGDKGIEATIVNPVENGKIYSDQLFEVAVRLINKGETKAEGATCIFGSFSPCECQSFALEGKRKVEKETLEGEEETLTFTGGQITASELGESSYYVTSKTRYDYKTYGIVKACVKKEAYSKEGCKIDQGKNMLKSASSAPLGILEVTEEIKPETDDTVKLVFSIKMKNIGGGSVYNLDEEKAQCESPQGIKQRIEVRMINTPGRATCNPAELKKEEATTRCTISNVKVFDESYESEITLELSYAYETVDSNMFEVG